MVAGIHKELDGLVRLTLNNFSEYNKNISQMEI